MSYVSRHEGRKTWDFLDLFRDVEVRDNYI
jgi:hypothetical protein